MKVTLINTSDAGGGAPAACLRLLNALALQGLDAQLLAQHKKTHQARVTGIVKGLVSSLKAKFTFLYERIPFMLFHEKDKTVRFAFSPANAGTSLKNDPLVNDADILHLHWTNSGFLSLADLQELIATGKPIVWTLHDMWTFTGGCHYAGTCNHFLNQCGNCYLLRDEAPDDISHSGWLRKAAMYAGAQNITFVACSQWLAGVAGQSSLLKNFRIEAIANPIDTTVFIPQDETEAREKWCINPFAKIILFGAANINDKRKGFTYLLQALEILNEDPEKADMVEVVIFGKSKHFDGAVLPFKVHKFDMISSQADLAEIYSLADVLVLPSLEDNLPNTVMEAMACGTPVVAFNTGGIPEMIDHRKNGYLAAFRSAADLAAGINEILYADNAVQLGLNAREKVLESYSNEKIAGQYIDLYKTLLKK
jgi:glycosyltransferase involved in cell wall biosynthesis